MQEHGGFETQIGGPFQAEVPIDVSGCRARNPVGEDTENGESASGEQ